MKSSELVHIKKQLELKMQSKEIISGRVLSSTVGGLVVEVMGIKAFMPDYMADNCEDVTKDFSFLVGQNVPIIIKRLGKNTLNRIRVSRRDALKLNRVNEQNIIINQGLCKFKVGQIIEGRVDRLTKYGALVDIDGIDGLLHNKNISWERVNHPSEKLKINDKITVKILKYNKEGVSVSLGLKQLIDSPWDGILDHLPIGKKVVGMVSSLTNYGAFVRIEAGIEGLVHATEMSWSRSKVTPSEVVKIGQKVEVVILDIQESEFRMSLSIRQAQKNPWKVFDSTYIKGDKITADIESVTDFGVFVSLPGGINGLIHLSDILWEKGRSIKNLNSIFHIGQRLEVKVMNVDVEKERISFSFKQLSRDVEILQEFTKDEVIVSGIGPEGKIMDKKNSKLKKIFFKKYNITPEMKKGKYQKFLVTIALRLGISISDTQEDISLVFSDGVFDNYGAEGRSENFIGRLSVNGVTYNGSVKVCTMGEKNDVINTLWPIHDDTEKQQQAKNSKTDEFIDYYMEGGTVLTTEEIATWYHPVFLDDPGLSPFEMSQIVKDKQLRLQKKMFHDKSEEQKAIHTKEITGWQNKVKEAERKNQEKATLKETNIQKLKEMSPEVDWSTSLSTTAVFDHWNVEGDFLCVYLISQSHPIRLKNTFRYDYPKALVTVKMLKNGDMISYDTKGASTFGSLQWFYKIRKEL
jgi:ribosomal protein S1